MGKCTTYICKDAHHRCQMVSQQPNYASPYDIGLKSECLLIFGYIMINSSLFMRIVTHVLLNMTILMLTLVQM